MEEKKITNKKYGRKQKSDPAVFRYSVSFNAVEHAKFLSLFEASGMLVKAHFISACIFQRTIKTVKIDKAAMDFYMRLTNLYGQFRAVGVNYNQVVKILYHHFSEKKAAAYLFKLEKQTVELATLCREIKQLIAEFEAKHINKKQEL